MKHWTLYVGTYTQGESEGIYRLEMDGQGSLTLVDVTTNSSNPSFLAFSPDGRYLYTSDELPDRAQISDYKVEQDGGLTFLSAGTYPGRGMCYVTVQNRVLIGANYGSGSVFTARVNEDGSPGELLSHVQHIGQSVNPERQEGPHAHCVYPGRDGRIFVADLGMDVLIAYELDSAGVLNEASRTALPPGEGARHLCFTRDGARAYLVTELGNQLFTYGYQSEDAFFTLESQVSTLPKGYTGESFAADIHLSPDERFLYVSNRGHDSIACFRLERNPRLNGFIPSGGAYPRSFALTPDGQYLVAANQNDHTVAAIVLDPETGLGKECSRIQVPSPVCILIR